MTNKTDDPRPDSSTTEAEYLQDTPLVPLPGVKPEDAENTEAKPKDADRPEAKPHGTLKDQINTMEGEGQAQPQAGELPPEEHDGSRVVRPDSEKHTGQAPPEDIDGGSPPEGTKLGDKGGTG